MKTILTLCAFLFFASALAAPIQVALQMPSGLQVGKNQFLAQVSAEPSYAGTPVSLVVDAGNSQPVKEVLLGKIGDPSLQGEVELASLSGSPSLTIKVTKPSARYATTQVVATNTTSAQFVLEAPRSRNANHFLVVLGALLAFAALGAIALRGEKSAF
jgi:hypothetical protein